METAKSWTQPNLQKHLAAASLIRENLGTLLLGQNAYSSQLN